MVLDVAAGVFVGYILLALLKRPIDAILKWLWNVEPVFAPQPIVQFVSSNSSISLTALSTGIAVPYSASKDDRSRSSCAPNFWRSAPV